MRNKKLAWNTISGLLLQVTTVLCGFVLPRAYNDNYGMTRCFRNIYMDANVLVQYSDAAQLLEEYHLNLQMI